METSCYVPGDKQQRHGYQVPSFHGAKSNGTACTFKRVLSERWGLCFNKQSKVSAIAVA